MQRNNDNFFDFFETLNNLEEIEREIISFCYYEGRTTIGNLEKKINVPQKELKLKIEELINKGLLFEYRFHNFIFYEINIRAQKILKYHKFPSGPVIPLIYHFNLLSDEKRTDGFKNAIENCVKKGDIVADLGCGTGILSIIAAKKGAYVFAIEVDEMIAEAAEYFVKNSGYSNKIKIITDDVRNVNLPDKVDVVICEMFDTALISELQVPVMNYFTKNWLKPNGKVIPLSAATSMEIINKDYSFYGFDFKIMHFEEYGSRLSNNSLSKPVIYHRINFYDENELEVSEKIQIMIDKKGVANGLKIKTKVFFDEHSCLEGSPWFNPPLILPFEDTEVEINDKMIADINYGLGGGFSSIRYNVELKKNE